MQIDRMMEMILMLLKRERVSAKEFADKFGVSTRTIYRDVDTLSLSGVPIYSIKGNKGGISILKSFTLDRTLISQKEQRDIVFALQSLKAAKYPDVDNTLEKISSVFKDIPEHDWI